MSKITAYSLFVSFITTGLFLAIQIKTGIDISPEGLTGKLLESISETMKTEETSSWFSNYIFLINMVGIISLVFDIALLLVFGKAGIIIGILGFFGGLLLFFFPTLGVVFLIIGVLISHFIDEFSKSY